MSTKIHVGLSGDYLRSVCLFLRITHRHESLSYFVGKRRLETESDVIADKGYDFYDVKKLIRDSGKYPVIPRRQGAIYPGTQPKDKEKYKTPNAIERFFGKIKEHKIDITFRLIAKN